MGGSPQGASWGSSRGFPGDLQGSQPLQGLGLLRPDASAPELLRGRAGFLAEPQAAWRSATPVPARRDTIPQARSPVQVLGTPTPAGGVRGCSKHARSASTGAPAAGGPATDEGWPSERGSRALSAAHDRGGEGSEGQSAQAKWWPEEARGSAPDAAQAADVAGVRRSAPGEQGPGRAGGRAPSAPPETMRPGSGARTALERWRLGETVGDAGSAAHGTGRGSGVGSAEAGIAAADHGRSDPGSAGFGSGSGHGGLTDILGFGDDSDEDAAAWNSGEGADLGRHWRDPGEVHEAGHSGCMKGEAALGAVKLALAEELSSEVRSA